MAAENEGFRLIQEFACDALVGPDLPELPKNKNCTGESMSAVDLIHKLLDVLDRREKEYMEVASKQNDHDTHTSFIARAAETGLFRTDLEMLLERLEEK